MIIVRNVSHIIGSNPILNDVSLGIPEGGITALIGPNGASRSTLFSFMARLQPLIHGDIGYAGKDIKTTPTAELARTLSILTQENSVTSHITMHDLLMFGHYPYHQGRSSETDKTIAEEVLAEFHLQGFANHYLTEFSGDQRQRAMTTMVFCQCIDCVLLDEPLNNPGMYHARSLMQTLRRPIDEYKHTTVVVLHGINRTAAYADHTVAMKSGQIAMQGTPNDIFTAENIKSLFDMDVNVLDYGGKKLVIHHTRIQ